MIGSLELKTLIKMQVAFVIIVLAGIPCAIGCAAASSPSQATGAEPGWWHRTPDGHAAPVPVRVADPSAMDIEKPNTRALPAPRTSPDKEANQGIGVSPKGIGAADSAPGAFVSSRLYRDRPEPPETLDRSALVEGFYSVGRSVNQCVSRHIKRRGERPAERIKVLVTISQDGRVSRFTIDRNLRSTVFGACMNAHSSRWLFPEFTGKPIQAAKKFVVQ